MIKARLAKITFFLCISLLILFGCSYSTTYTSSSSLVFKSAKSLPYDVETHYNGGGLKTAIRVTGISCKDDENYVTKNRDAEITIYYEILYNDLRDDLYAIDITDSNGNYPMIQDGRIYGNSDEKKEAKDIYLDLWTREAHTKDSITFPIRDIEKGTYNLLVRSID